MRTSDEELSYLPGSIYNRDTAQTRQKEDAETIKRLHQDLRELYEASLGGSEPRMSKAQSRVKNTLNWLEY